MFDIGWSELLVIAVVAIVVVGPKDLPRLMRSFGHYAGKLRRAASDFQSQFEEAMRESEIGEVRKAIDSVRENSPSVDLKAPIDKPVMLPKPTPQPSVPNAQSAGVAATLPETKPKPAPRKKQAPSKPKTPRAKHAKKSTEPGQ
jgi:sec-independent protein translocase protein TatB